MSFLDDWKEWSTAKKAISIIVVCCIGIIIIAVIGGGLSHVTCRFNITFFFNAH